MPVLDGETVANTIGRKSDCMPDLLSEVDSLQMKFLTEITRLL